MIYVSTSCVKNNKITESIQQLVDNDISNIELSGGTKYYDHLEYDLLQLKQKYNLNYICHNYFPPPKEDFVLNLASLNDEIYEKTLEHLLKSIELSKKLSAKKYGFHAGYFMDIDVSEIGKKVTYSKTFDKEKSLIRFCEGFRILQKSAGSIELYIENNVFSDTNYKTFDGEQFIMLCSYADMLELKQEIDFKMLLDIGHLKVSSNTLNLNFEEEFLKIAQTTDYLHLSDNDGLHDLNFKLKKDSDIYKLLNKQDMYNKDITLEVYGKMDEIKSSYAVVEELMSNKSEQFIRRKSMQKISKYISLVEKAVKLPYFNKEELFHSIKVADYISAVVQTKDNKFVLVKQYRPALEKYTIELPSGMLDEGEMPQDAIRREVYEETGLICDNDDIQYLGKLSPDTGRHQNSLWAYYIKNAYMEKNKEFVPEDGIEIIYVTKDELLNMVLNNTFDHALHLAVLYLLDLKK